jgi:putative adenylate-forming enzyme
LPRYRGDRRVTPGMALVLAYLRTRILQLVLRRRKWLETWQSWNLERLRRYAIANIAFYQELGDARFAAFPTVTKQDVMARFEAFNSLALTAPQLWAMLDRGDAPAKHDIGCSSGTSGNRGLYLISDIERFVWLGTIVAKALPDALLRAHRVAIVLPRESRLYAAANESKLLKLMFFDLGDGLHAIADALAAFEPTVLVGPPKALRWFAEHGTTITPQRIYASAEVTDPPDRKAIEQHFGVLLRQIYMATEGLFGVSCNYGTLHLAEDIVHFEFEQVGDQHDLVTPIVTDFIRRTQVMARYRLNDMLRLDRRRCRCGSSMQAVSEIVGRRDDAFQLPSVELAGGTIMLTPDVLRNAVLATDRAIDDFRVRQIGANQIEVVLPDRIDRNIGERAQRALLQACRRVGTCPEVTLRHETLSSQLETKLRRVENRWKPSG